MTKQSGNIIPNYNNDNNKSGKKPKKPINALIVCLGGGAPRLQFLPTKLHCIIRHKKRTRKERFSFAYKTLGFLNSKARPNQTVVSSEKDPFTFKFLCFPFNLNEAAWGGNNKSIPKIHLWWSTCEIGGSHQSKFNSATTIMTFQIRMFY